MVDEEPADDPGSLTPEGALVGECGFFMKFTICQ